MTTQIDLAGNTITADTFTGSVTGNITGNITGNVTGNLTGNVTGNVTGGVTFPSSDPAVAGMWWDNAGTLTKSAG